MMFSCALVVVMFSCALVCDVFVRHVVLIVFINKYMTRREIPVPLFTKVLVG